MTRAHVRLLGPCFKTGRVGCRPIRHRSRAPDGLSRSDRSRRARSGDTVDPVPPRRNARGEPRRQGRGDGRSSVPDGRPVNDATAVRAAGTCESAETDRTPDGHLPRRLVAAGEPVVALCPREVHASLADGTGPGSSAFSSISQNRPRCQRPGGRVESRGPTLRAHPFTSRRFHVLLNSLFKVLFNFPSRYLSAIGLVQVFSLRWSLPPALGCILKQPDSGEAPRDGGGSRRGLTPAPGKAPIRRTRTSTARPRGSPKHHSSRCPQDRRFGAGLFPLHSPLLGESLLVSFPPLSDMLKFSG